MKIFGISGLGADERVFKYLKLNHKIIPINWIEPLIDESIGNYAKRLAKINRIDKEENFAIIGVSFGGLVAVEMSKLYNPYITILISSVETKYEINKSLNILGRTKIISILPEILFNPPRRIAGFLFGTKNKELLNSILDDTNLKFAKWAINELLVWDNKIKLQNVLKIYGENDKLLPPKDKTAIIINNGGHFMIVDRAEEISKIINQKLKIRHHNKRL